MSDPFSIAGSAVGVISLGISTCSGILEYYSQWKEYDNDIAQTYQHISQLQSVLRSIDSAVASLPVCGPKETRALVQSHLLDSEASVQKLKKRLDKIRSTASPQNASLTQTAVAKLERHKRRLLYPFQQGTLGKLRDAALEAQDRLALVLQTLNL
jgi:hypothetical protein